MLLILAAQCWAAAPAQKKVTVPTDPPMNGSGLHFRDGKYGVRFEVPAGWEFTRKDREVSTFRLDARTASPKSQVRGVASLSYNPFPQSVLSGALVYFSVLKHSNDQACEAEAIGSPASGPETPHAEPQNIGGMNFAHGHDEHGGICVESRDEIYTAFRKGSCYRFDLAVNTFCAVSSGASELSHQQMRTLEAQMAGILSTVELDWEKSGRQSVATPDVPVQPKTPVRKTIPTV
jgi:hypothetical protein